MNKIIYFIYLLLFSAFAHADTFNFQPTPGDVSVQFLGNVFGVVDGVLHGNNQLFGILMGVFNSMVLALGGVVITYTLIVSTLNTAKDGKMLGEKFNSMWVPLRSVIGLGLLVPKLSGYCALQVLMMWITVQGVGAADRLWEATLSYLNRGGRIVAAVSDSANKKSSGGYQQIKLATVSSYMLSGQVCMLGLQQLFQDEQSKLQRQKSSALGGGACDNDLSKQPPLCYSAVPNFIDSVNAIDYQVNHPAAGSSSPDFTMPMPNFKEDSPYASLNGICGSISWDSLERTYPNLNSSKLKKINLNQSESQAVSMSRAVALQQVYTDLSSLAYSMVENFTAIKPEDKNKYSIVAKNQFGVPWNSTSNSICTDNTGCDSWQGEVTSSEISHAAIFTGTELQLAMRDYNTIIAPSLNLASQMSNTNSMNQIRSFINSARSKGWIMAGSYFYNIVRLGGSSASSQLGENAGNLYDINIYESDSSAPNFISDGAGLLYDDAKNCKKGPYNSVCNWIGTDGYKPISLLSTLINGDLLKQANMPSWSDAITSYKKGSDGSKATPVKGEGSSTVLGYVNNGFMIMIPGQIIEKPIFKLVINKEPYNTQDIGYSSDVECYRMKVIWYCLGKILGKVFWFLLGEVIRWISSMMATVVKLILNQLLAYPLALAYYQLQTSVITLLAPNLNPMVAIALTGNEMINAAITMFYNQMSTLIGFTAMGIFFAPAIFILAIIGIVIFPINYALIGLFTMLGATAAFYIPLIPYMIYTFGAMGWMIAVVEAMVAAPLVALGISHPDGHDAFGKSEQAISIILNVFLRPGLMVIGYMAGNILSYVFAWMVATGYNQAVNFMVGQDKSSGVTTIYNSYSVMLASFMVIITYMSMYTSAVQKAFSLIYHLPDKVIRWIGGHPESYGEESMRSVEQIKEPTQKAYEGISTGLGKGAGEAKDQVSEGAKSKAEGKNRKEQMDLLGKIANNTGGGGGGGGGGGS